LHGDAQRVVQLLSDICVGHSPAKVLTRRHKHPSSGERRGNIYSLKLIQRMVEADGPGSHRQSRASAFYLAHKPAGILRASRFEKLARVFITETHRGLVQSLPGYPADERSWFRAWHRLVAHIKHQVTTRQNL